MLKKIKFQAIRKYEGMIMLASIERKLDKINKDGVPVRLKKKN